MLKRQLPIVIVVVVGFLTLGGHFINNAPLKNFIDNDATQWYDIIAGFAVFLGSLNLLKLHLTRVFRKTKNWQYSIFSVVGFLLMIIFGFVYHGSEVEWGKHLDAKDSYFYWMYWYIYQPLSTTMFALLAFFVASASYRAFRIRNYEATLLLISGIILMLGRVPIGSLIPWWAIVGMYVALIFSLIKSYFKSKNLSIYSFVAIYMFLILIGDFIFGWGQDTPSFLKLNDIQQWIFNIPATAGATAIMIGIAIGTIAQSYRIITGRERSILGE
tara:strand:+ start:107 stop:922 length:816 start_codon:yes stop_codon:yes gene_type:complete